MVQQKKKKRKTISEGENDTENIPRGTNKEAISEGEQKGVEKCIVPRGTVQLPEEFTSSIVCGGENIPRGTAIVSEVNLSKFSGEAVNVPCGTQKCLDTLTNQSDSPQKSVPRGTQVVRGVAFGEKGEVLPPNPLWIIKDLNMKRFFSSFL